MTISIKETTGPFPPAIPFEIFRINHICADISWEPTIATHKDFNWNRFEEALDRLAVRIRSGSTIVSVAVKTTGPVYVS